MSGWLLYLILRLDSIHCILEVCIAFMFLIGLLCFVPLIMENGWGDQKLLSAFKKYLLVLVSLIFFLMIVPTTKEAFVIYTVPKIVNNEELRDIPKLTIKAVKQWLLEKIESFENKKSAKEVKR